MEYANPLERNYIVGEVLGIGTFAKVKIAQHVRTGQNVAVKIINRTMMRSPTNQEKVRREIKIGQLCVHPHVIRVYEVIETPTNIYVIMEHMMKGELFDYITEKKRLQEDEARHYFQQIIAGVEYCHRNNVVHRDLKLENLLLDEKGNVKIADFGLSNIMKDGNLLRTACGSPNYAAPEIISAQPYGPEVDIWSCGIILYALLCGALPFDDTNIPFLFKKIKAGRYSLPDQLSAGACDLIKRILVVDPTRRLTIHGIRQHPWFILNLPPCLTLNAAQHIDDEIIEQVVVLGFDRGQLIHSLQSNLQNDATITYYLLLDHRSNNATASSSSTPFSWRGLTSSLCLLVKKGL
ncbi:SNF1-related protein kinase catalytic subunit alpha KIN10-like [Salvia splendens]|uniref:SNF1-related protein kinase catalytic subunit alpha KIN10-like n=1 Tax=Salvia splendens TaxID=180675 RepID=UPI001C275FA0|nr:SNF1-related protein kinase catalytic subunit alpha KIN10-like [Salvia splendens]